MPDPESTRWSLIRGAAGGEAAARAVFAKVYERVVRAYLGARWRHSTLSREMDDAVQEVFLDCFRSEGALSRVEPGRPGGFRGFLFGVVRNVARRFEERRSRRAHQPEGLVDLDAVEAREETLSRAFDRAWARSLIDEAGHLHAERARVEGEAGARRVELLRLRFQEGVPIREIAMRWGEDAAHLHHQYARARKEFGQALREVVGRHHPGGPREVEAECARLVTFLR